MANQFDINIVPFCETSHATGRGFLFSFGAYGTTNLVVLAVHLEDALEEALEWLDDNAPGHLSTIGPAEYEEAAKELGLNWRDAAHDAMSEADMARVTELAEAGMTMVSHTTLKHGNCIPSWEWHARELLDDELAVIEARNRHYVCGSGQPGCLYDYGPNFHETEEDAIEDLCGLFGYSISEDELTEMRANLKKDGIHYFSDAAEAGAAYAEVSEQPGPMPTDEDS